MNGKKDIRILVVEDDFLVAEMIEGVLEESGYCVLAKAMDGAEAVDMALRLKPDVILMDVHLPVMNGLDAAREILKHQPTPIVVLTAYEHRELVEEARQAGVAGFLVKPPSPQALERAIAVAMARVQGDAPKKPDPQ